MFAFYGGVAHVTVPDCLKQGVLKCHLYDPDLNPGYAQLATSILNMLSFRRGQVIRRIKRSQKDW